jgi:xanthine dehydrogenase YagT iron-sulfur-binding subunit
MDVEITLQVNGTARSLCIDTRTTLLDALRERLGLTGSRRDATTGSAAPALSC